jgi:hypothetical protein
LFANAGIMSGKTFSMSYNRACLAGGMGRALWKMYSTAVCHRRGGVGWEIPTEAGVHTCGGAAMHPAG